MRYTSRIILGLAVLTVVACLGQVALAHGAERGDATATLDGAHVTIDYGRPLLKGRDPLSLIKPGQVWRIGADSPTTLESDRDLDIGGTRVPKGKHILLARLDTPGKWTLVVSTKPWMMYDSSAKIAETPMTYATAQGPVEMVTIKLTGHNGAGQIEIAWGKLRLTAEIKAAS